MTRVRENASARADRSTWLVTSAMVMTSGTETASPNASARRVRSEAGSDRRRRGRSQGSMPISAPKPL